MEQVAIKKDLKMHKKLLLDVIKRQAGTLEKAILEGLMNSIEAGASRIDVDFIEVDGKAFLSIKDDGEGITTEKQIIEHFETFGTPHDESERKVYAQFRMGRGQMFSFGHNVWKTASFVMDVDINKNGLTYHLLKKQPYLDGCQIDIELYENPIGGWACRSIDSLKEQVKNQIEFVTTPIYFNGEKINNSPNVLTWTKEDKYAYYLFGVGDGVKIYNLGAFVKTIPSYQAGTSGIIVSKKMLAVNFARNDIQSDCKIYSHIQDVVRENRKDNAKKTYKKLTSNERKAILIDIRDASQEFKDIKSVKCFRTAQSKWLSIDNILKNSQKWCFAPEGSPIADTIMEQGKALCLDEDMIYSLGYSGKRKEFFSWLLKEYLRTDSIHYSEKWTVKILKEKIDPQLKLKIKNYIPFDKSFLENEDNETLSDSFSSQYIIFPNEKLTVVEKRILKVVSKYSCFKGRQICIGKSDEAIAWTDGSTYIALNRDWLKNLYLRSGADVALLFSTFCHEMAHDNDSQGTHIHGIDFYENYYKITKNRYDSPFAYVSVFYDDMNRIKIDELAEKKKQKEIDKKLKRDKKLGLVTS